MRSPEMFLRAFAGQPAADVVGDEGQQFLIARSEGDVRLIALHGDGANNHAVAHQRYAEPAVRERTNAAHAADGFHVGDACAIGQ